MLKCVITIKKQMVLKFLIKSKQNKTNLIKKNGLLIKVFVVSINT